MNNSYDEWVIRNLCTGSTSYSDMMKCNCDNCSKLRRMERKLKEDFEK